MCVNELLLLFYKMCDANVVKVIESDALSQNNELADDFSFDGPIDAQLCSLI